ncbi:MAG: hypothetical protein ACRYGA_15415 [Janthinobacterium lividum]
MVGLRRRPALAVARRRSGGTSASPSTIMTTSVPTHAIAPRGDEKIDAGTVALDQRVRETGEW